MSTQIEKFKLEEKLRRLFFKYRGDVLAVAREAGLEDQIEYVRKVTGRIKRGFNHDANFEIACFVTDALLAGREQRLIILEDRVQALLKKQNILSVCHNAPVTVHTFDDELHYKCNICESDCHIITEDGTPDRSVLQYIDRMRKEDELIYKFMVTMGFISKLDGKDTASVHQLPPNIIENSAKPFTDEDAKMMQQMQNMDGTTLSELRKTVEDTLHNAK